MNRNSVSMLWLGLTAIAGVLFAINLSFTQPPVAKKGVQWEYKCLKGLDILSNEDRDEVIKSALLNANDKSIKPFEKGLNKLGDEGWELVTMSEGILIFKRTK